MRKSLFRGLTALGLALPASTSSAAVFITEIHYNGSGSEGAAQEWIEIYNSGSASVDLSGWTYEDIQDNEVSGAFPSGTILNGNSAAIAVAQDPAQIAQMWGTGVQVITIPTGISLSNSASPTNENLAIRDSGGTIVDSVNYEAATNGWPASSNRASIYLIPSAVGAADPIVANDTGSNWALSVSGTDGASTASVANPAIAGGSPTTDFASPGVVVSVVATPEPASLALIPLAGLAALRRRRRA